MGATFSRIYNGQAKPGPDVEVTITGLGCAWPPLIIGPEQFNEYVTRQYSSEALWVKSLLKVNQQTRIDTRAVIDVWQDPTWTGNQVPSAEHVDQAYRQYGVSLAADAARKALGESHVSPSAITHMVCVTATNAGSPGFDQLVAHKLGVSADTEKILLTGVGCAGGLAAVRVASTLAAAASFRGETARILVIACEICSTLIRGELHAASLTEQVGIGPALFGDGAAALTICNAQAMTDNTPAFFGISRCCTRTIPETSNAMAYRTSSNGFLLSLSKLVPQYAASAVCEPFDSLKMACGKATKRPSEFDWALHPGGLAIIKGVQASMELPGRALQATNHIYRTRGNASSVAVLAVLDHMRTIKAARKDIIACSFGPGLIVEMALLERLF